MKRMGNEFKRAKPRKTTESAENTLLVLDSIVWLLKSKYAEDAPAGNSSSYGFIARHLIVKFSKEISDEELHSDYSDGTFEILAPEIEGETQQQREKRRRELLLFYGPILPESQIRATSQIQKLLSLSAQKELIRQFLSEKEKRQE
jgi:hypothetical protein